MKSEKWKLKASSGLTLRADEGTSALGRENVKEKAKRDTLRGNAVKLFKLDIDGWKLAKVA